MNPHTEALEPLPEKRSLVGHVTHILKQAWTRTKTLLVRLWGRVTTMWHNTDAWVQDVSRRQVDEARAGVQRIEHGSVSAGRIFLAISLSIVGALGFALLIASLSPWITERTGIQLTIMIAALILAGTVLGSWLVNSSTTGVMLRRFWVVFVAGLVAFSVSGLLKATEIALEILSFI